MKKLFSLLLVFTLVAISSIALAADAVVTPAAVPSVSTYFSWFTANWGLIAGVLLAVEQVLAATSLKSNSTFQLICNLVDALVKKKEPVQ